MLLVEKYAIESSGISVLGIISIGLGSERVLDGALALCGPVGGGRKQTDYVGHTRALFDFFCPGVIPGDVLHVEATDYSNTSPQVQAIVGSILANPNAAVALASVDQIELPWTSFPELITSIVRVLGYNILGTNDLLKRTGGASPFENPNVTYTGLAALDAAVHARVDGGARWGRTRERSQGLDSKGGTPAAVPARRGGRPDAGLRGRRNDVRIGREHVDRPA